MTSPLHPVPLICAAIEQTRMLRLIYHNKERMIEPHDHGILNGSLQLLVGRQRQELLWFR